MKRLYTSTLIGVTMLGVAASAIILFPQSAAAHAPASLSFARTVGAQASHMSSALASRHIFNQAVTHMAGHTAAMHRAAEVASLHSHTSYTRAATYMRSTPRYTMASRSSTYASSMHGYGQTRYMAGSTTHNCPHMSTTSTGSGK